MVRVVVRRHLKEGKKADLMPMLRELRRAAMKQPGYITGETLASTENPSIMAVLSTWQSLEAWKAWESGDIEHAGEMAAKLFGTESYNATGQYIQLLQAFVTGKYNEACTFIKRLIQLIQNMRNSTKQ